MPRPADLHSNDEVSLRIEGEALVGGTQRRGPGDFQFMPGGVDDAVIESPPGLVARFIPYTVQRWSR